MKRCVYVALPFVLLFASSGVRAGSTDDPCAVVDRNDVAQALQATVTSVVHRALGDHITCSYRTSSIGRRMVVTIGRFDSPEEAKSEFGTSISSSMLAVAPSVPLRGIGDGAQRMGPSVYAVKGTVLYVFTPLERDGNGAGAQRTIALAKSTLARAH